MIKLHKNELFMIIFFVLEIIIQTCCVRHIKYSLILEAMAVLMLALINKVHFRISWRRHSLRNCYILFLAYRLLADISSYLVSGFANREAWVSIKHTLGLELMPLIFWSLAVNYVPRDKIVRFIRNFCFAMSFFGVYEFVMKKPILGILSNVIPWQTGSLYEEYIYNVLYNMDRVRIIFFHPIICAVCMLVGLIFMLYFPFKNEVVMIIAFILNIITIIGTQSRSTWVSLVIVLFLFFIRRNWSRIVKLPSKRLLLAGVVLAVGIIAIMLGGGAWIGDIVESVTIRWSAGMDENNVSNYNRVTMIRMGINDFCTSSPIYMLLGHGGGYALEFLNSHPILGWTTAVDNQYLTVLMNYGIIGFVLYFFMPFKCFMDFFHFKDKSSNCMRISLISIFISSFFYESLSWKYVMLLFACLLNLLDNFENRRICNREKIQGKLAEY